MQSYTNEIIKDFELNFNLNLKHYQKLKNVKINKKIFWYTTNLKRAYSHKQRICSFLLQK